MTPAEYAVILVHSTSHAMRVEKVLHAAGLACKLIPVPRQISSDCGVCIRVRNQDLEAALQAAKMAQIEVEGVHLL
jgi:bacterioferritin-associated ferredoxin